MKEKTFTVTNDTQVVCAIWDNVKKPIGIIQIIHGICDNIKTYNRFAKFMNKNGYIVFGADRPPCGYRDNSICCFDKSVQLQINIMNYLITKYNLPVLIFGYGYGGIVTQSILQKSTTPAAGVCLANVGKYSAFALNVAEFFAWCCAKIFGKNAPANILNRLSFGKRRCRSKVKCTHEFYISLFHGIKSIKPNVAFNTPILMISGASDSYATNPRFSQALYNAYRNNGIMNVTMIIYPDNGDNLLMEMNFGSMPDDILDFIKYATRNDYSATNTDALPS
ncbi:MAG: alpha/beta hydrolase [Alphaproteobacteria bacterium]|nr:alpha/beta hydrolase [Alphaproteobacteria bacterium]